MIGKIKSIVHDISFVNMFTCAIMPLIYNNIICLFFFNIFVNKSLFEKVVSNLPD